VTHQVHHLEYADQIFFLRNVDFLLFFEIQAFFSNIKMIKQMKGKLVAQGTYNELVKTHLSLLTSIETEDANEERNVDDNDLDELISKEAEAISKEMKAREEVLDLMNVKIY
jgi:hypothetical protein